MTAPSIKEALELLPCPFCGGREVTLSHRWDYGFNRRYPYCDGCFARGPSFNEEEEARAWWNTRATLQPFGERREAIARILEPQAWAALGIGDTLAYKNRRTSSLRKADRILASVLVRDEAGWRDISTAPKDKIDGIIARRVLLANTHGSMFIGYWSADYECWQDTSTHARIFYAATHWMPLPTPPIRSDRDGGEG